MPTVAEQLRDAREEQKLTIYQAAEITKIKTDHIRALEAGQYEVFSAPVYIRGFVRTYAKALKLDAARLAADLEAELARNEQFVEPVGVTGRASGPMDFLTLQLSKLNWRIAVGAVIVVAAGLAVLSGAQSCTRARAADPLKKLGPGLYQPTQELSGDLLPLPTTPRNP